MVNQRAGQAPPDEGMDALFLALSDPTRRGMVARLARGPASVGELGEPYPISKPAVTKHLKVLERAGLVRRERRGRVHRISLRPEAMRRAGDWLDFHRRFWEKRLDSLAAYVEAKRRAGDTPRDEGGER